MIYTNIFRSRYIILRADHYADPMRELYDVLLWGIYMHNLIPIFHLILGLNYAYIFPGVGRCRWGSSGISISMESIANAVPSHLHGTRFSGVPIRGPSSGSGGSYKHTWCMVWCYRGST